MRGWKTNRTKADSNENKQIWWNNGDIIYWPLGRTSLRHWAEILWASIWWTVEDPWPRREVHWPGLSSGWWAGGCSPTCPRPTVPPYTKISLQPINVVVANCWYIIILHHGSTSLLENPKSGPYEAKNHEIFCLAGLPGTSQVQWIRIGL